MKSVRLLFSIGLHCLVVDVESQAPSQAQGLSRAQFKQYATAFLGMKDSENMVSDFFDEDDDDTPKPSVQKITKGAPTTKPAQHGTTVAAPSHNNEKVQASPKGKVKSAGHKSMSAALLDEKHGMKASVHDGAKSFQHGAASVSQTAKTAKATRAVSGQFKVKASHVAASASDDSNHLKSQLAQAVRVQYSLRMRLKQISGEARKSLAQLLKQIQAAKAGAQRSEIKLQKQVKQEIAERKKAEASEKELSKQLSATKVLAISAGKAASVAASKAIAKAKSDHEAVNKLREEFQKEVAHLKQEEAEALSARHTAAKDEAASKSKLREKMRISQEQATKEINMLKDQLHQSKQELAKIRSQFTDKAEAHQLETKLRNDLQKESAARKTAEASAGELRKQLVAAKAAALSASGAAAAAAATAAAKEKSDREAVSKLREEFQKAMSNVKQEEAQALSQSQAAAKVQAESDEKVGKLNAEVKATKMQAKQEIEQLKMQAAQEESKLKAQIALLQHTGGKVQSQIADVSPKSTQVAVPQLASVADPKVASMADSKVASIDDGKGKSSHSTLQMMAAFFSKPLAR